MRFLKVFGAGSFFSFWVVGLARVRPLVPRNLQVVE